ncbi:hypothetical protein Tco_1367812 [Tanacetum coccineum]
MRSRTLNSDPNTPLGLFLKPNALWAIIKPNAPSCGDDVDGGVGWQWEWCDDGYVVVTRWQGGVDDDGAAAAAVGGGVEMRDGGGVVRLWKVVVLGVVTSGVVEVILGSGGWPESGRKRWEAPKNFWRGRSV